jgi:zona occludens toxin
MTISVYTGTPGAGKTLYVVKLIVEQLSKDPTRRVFHNIAGFSFAGCHDIGEGHDDDGPDTWEKYPDGSIFVFDEIQHQWPAERPHTKVPPAVKALDKHRHRGVDFHLITQDPMSLDVRVRRLASLHKHIYRIYGQEFSRVRVWNSISKDPQPTQNEDNAEKEVFKFPKEYFGLYTSSVLHNVKRLVPWRLVYWSLAGLAVVALAGFLMWSTFGPGSAYSDRVRAATSDTGDVSESLPSRVCAPIISDRPLRVRIGPYIVRLDTVSNTGLVRTDNREGRNYACIDPAGSANRIQAPI